MGLFIYSYLFYFK